MINYIVRREREKDYKIQKNSISKKIQDNGIKS